MQNTDIVNEAVNWVLTHFPDEYKAMVGAPIFFSAAVLILLLLAWLAIQHQYRHVIDSKDSIIESKNAHIELLDARIAQRDEQIAEFSDKVNKEPTISREQILVRVRELRERVYKADDMQLQLQIPSWQATRSQTGVTKVFIRVVLLNTGAPTAVHRWQAGVRFSNGRGFGVSENVLLHSQDREFDGLPNIVFDESPIPQGGRRSGYVIFQVVDPEPNMSKGGMMQASVYCEDVTGKGYSAKQPSDEQWQLMMKTFTTTATVTGKVS